MERGEVHIRRQVSEHDPVYQEERERGRNAHRDTILFGIEVSLYDHEKRTSERVAATNTRLEEELAIREDKQDESSQRLVQRIAKNKESAAGWLNEKAEKLRESFGDFIKNVYLLQSQSPETDREAFVRNEIGFMFDTPEIQEEMKKHFGQDLSEFTALNVCIKTIDHLISDELLYAVTKRHVERMRDQEKQLESIVVETKAEFKTAIERGVAEGWLPPAAGEALSRLDLAKVELSDQLKRLSSYVMGDANTYGKIGVSSEQLQPKFIPQLKHTLFHEFLHILSGISVTINTEKRAGGSDIHRIQQRKSGVLLRPRRDFTRQIAGLMKQSPNGWLFVCQDIIKILEKTRIKDLHFTRLNGESSIVSFLMALLSVPRWMRILKILPLTSRRKSVDNIMPDF